MPGKLGIPFGDIRQVALSELIRGCFASDQESVPIPCRWHEWTAPDCHVGVFCNLVSHLEALRDLLTHGTWCDEYLLPEGWTTPNDAMVEPIISHMTLAFLIWEPLAEDYRNLHSMAPGGETSISRTSELRGWINQVLKHRHRGNVHHRVHHHGPYLFEDHPNNEDYERDSEPTISRNGELQHSDGRAWARVVVPSLISAITTLAEMTAAIDERLTTDPAAAARIEAAYGGPPPPW